MGSLLEIHGPLCPNKMTNLLDTSDELLSQLELDGSVSSEKHNEDISDILNEYDTTTFTKTYSYSINCLCK